MPNGYARLSHVKADVAGLGPSNVDLDATLLRLIEEVSREFDRDANRQFYSSVATRYFTADYGSTLWLDGDLLSVTGLGIDVDGDGVFEVTLAANTDYWLWPDNTPPYRRIDLNSMGQQAVWPTYRRRVQVSGLWGYSNETELTGLTVGALMDASQTAITVTSALAAVDPGETIVIGSEQLYVSSVTASALTVTRGLNGSTAATHAQGTAIYRRRYPADVEEAVKERTVGLRWETQSGYQGSATLIGDAVGAANSTQVRATFARWRTAIRAYRGAPAVA